ncbi:MAG: DegT/DnrJ/EryC1/StrS family aminotransferase [Planctomycetes bacterium]|nr:DegT/DnrJ/EryC1/StrS family aminotransferase [Planctomycetota bacterium]
MRSVSMIDLQGEFELFGAEVRRAVDEVLAGQQFIGGPQVAELEARIAARLGAEHAVAVSNGTDALLCALMALDIGAGDEVAVPSFTFFATAGSVARVGARPVFVDIDPRTFNLDADKLEAAISPRTRAVMPVHLFGQCADMDAINAVARRHGMAVIEDAAQAIGATYRGRAACTLGDVACLSFYPTKNLGGFGEGGMIVTNDAERAAVCRQLRNHGESQRYHHDRVGGNFRLDTLKAAILLVKLRYLDEFNRRRRAHAALYDALLTDLPVTVPHRASFGEPVYHHYSILSDRRDELMAHLRACGVGCGVYYPVPLHLQKCFSDLGYAPGSLPITEQVCGRILSLPVHPMLQEADLRHVAACIGEFHGAGARRAQPAAAQRGA